MEQSIIETKGDGDLNLWYTHHILRTLVVAIFIIYPGSHNCVIAPAPACGTIDRPTSSYISRHIREKVSREGR